MAKQVPAADPDNQSAQIVVKRVNDAFVVRVPVKFYRRKGRQMILSQADASGNEHCELGSNHTLIANLAKAYRWQEQLESGEYATVEDLAFEKKVDVSYVRRMFRLNSLAPDIVQAILCDDAPDYLSLRTLYRGIAPGWAQQRRALLTN